MLREDSDDAGVGTERLRAQRRKHGREAVEDRSVGVDDGRRAGVEVVAGGGHGDGERRVVPVAVRGESNGLGVAVYADNVGGPPAGRSRIGGARAEEKKDGNVEQVRG